MASNRPERYKPKKVAGFNDFRHLEHNIDFEDEEWIERIDRLREAFIGNYQSIRKLNTYEMKLFKYVQRAFAIVADPNISEEEELSAVAAFIDESKEYSHRIIKIVRALVTRPKMVNKQFKREVVSSHVWQMYQDTKEAGELEVALEFLKEYNKLENLYDHSDKKVDPTTLIIPIPVYSSNPAIIEADDAEIVTNE